MVSSLDLHPREGARFVCERLPGEPTRYAATVYLAGDATVTATLEWDAAGHAVLTPRPDDPWVGEELLKLARVLRHTQQDRLCRWRGR